MGDVIKFMTRKDFVKSQAAKETKWTLSKSLQKGEISLVLAGHGCGGSVSCEVKRWLIDAEKHLSEDDYVEFLEAVIDPYIYAAAEPEIQTLVDGFYRLREAGAF